MKMKIFIPLTIGLLLCSLSSFSQEKSKKNEFNAKSPIYMDASQSVENRVKDLMSKMTLEEKVHQIQ